VIIPPDPIREAAAYQRYLLDALGEDDPADAQATTATTMRELIDAAGSDLRTRPAEGEWSVLECLGHILDAEVVYSGRYRWTIAHEAPELIGYDQDLWVARLGHVDDDPEALFAHFSAMRIANLALWRGSSVDDRRRVGIHRERGPESYDLSFRLIGGHDRIHLAQARAALAAVGDLRSAG